jgi:hypothetical protein
MEQPANEHDPRFQVAVRASEDGRFTFQIFTLSGEPRTFHASSETYATPADAAKAGYEAIEAPAVPRNCRHRAIRSADRWPDRAVVGALRPKANRDLSPPGGTRTMPVGAGAVMGSQEADGSRRATTDTTSDH